MRANDINEPNIREFFSLLDERNILDTLFFSAAVTLHLRRLNSL
jgi:hypothetical protein